MGFASHPAGELRLPISLPHHHQAATGKRPWVPLGLGLFPKE
jgi:hypothetical protein